MLPDSSTWQFCTISGAPYEFDSNKKVLKYVGTRKNNTEVQKKEQFFYNILNNLPLSVHIKDVENDFRYVFAMKRVSSCLVPVKIKLLMMC